MPSGYPNDGNVRQFPVRDAKLNAVAERENAARQRLIEATSLVMSNQQMRKMNERDLLMVIVALLALEG